MLTIHGLDNCDACRKLRKQLVARGLEHRFVDVRAQVPAAAELTEWGAQLGWDTLLNRKSTSWRQLDEARRALQSTEQVIALVQEFPSLLKRPLVVIDGRASIGLPAGIV